MESFSIVQLSVLTLAASFFLMSASRNFADSSLSGIQDFFFFGDVRSLEKSVALSTPSGRSAANVFVVPIHTMLIQ